MKKSRDFIEQRQHKRAFVQNLIVGILNSDEPVSKDQSPIFHWVVSNLRIMNSERRRMNVPSIQLIS